MQVGRKSKLNEHQYAQIQILRSSGSSFGEIGKQLGIGKSTIRRVIAGEIKSQTRKVHEGYDTSGEMFSENPDGSAVMSSITTRPIKSIKDAIAACGVDEKVWHVSGWKCTTWTVGMKLKKSKESGEKVVQTQQYRVSLTLVRLVPRHISDGLEAIYKRFGDNAKSYSPPAISTKKDSKENYLGVIGLFDSHFGKLCWAKETGTPYDLKIAESIYRNAVTDLIEESSHRRIDRWLLPIGNDFFHIDNSRNTTYNGTPQDVDGRFQKIIESGYTATVWAVEELMKTSHVDIKLVPGNHDPTEAFHLAMFLSAWFRKAKNVSVDYGPSPRKYYTYGATLLGLTHGNEEKHDQLPTLMATERPSDWSNSTCREWLLGHMHRSRQFVTKPVDTYNGTTVRVLRSATGTDSWHHRKGYVGTQPGAEVYFYGHSRGYAGHSVVNART